MFLVVASLTPIVNVDILIVKEGNILLSWRDDEQCGAGWHLPGECVRLKNFRTKTSCLCQKWTWYGYSLRYETRINY